MVVKDKDGSGFGIMSPDVPGISLDRPGMWTYTGDFIAKESNVFFNLFNNQWSTNFTEWVEGSWSTSFYLWSFDNYDPEKSLITPAQDLRIPLKAAFSEGTSGKLPVASEGISLSEKGILVTAFGPNPDGQGYLLRLWEQAGNSGKCTVSLPEGVNAKSAQPVDLRGQKMGKLIKCKNGKFDLKYSGNKPYSFVIL